MQRDSENPSKTSVDSQGKPNQLRTNSIQDTTFSNHVGQKTPNYRVPNAISAFSSPFKGFGYFISNPKLWFFPLLVVTIAIFLSLLAVTAVAIYTWPTYDDSVWRFILDIFITLGLTGATLLLFWVAVLPIMLCFAFDSLVRQIYRKKGIAIIEEKAFSSMKSAVEVLLRTIGWRILWPVLGLFTSFFLGPIGIFISEFGIGHIAAIDAFDLALAMRGISGKQRARLAVLHKKDIFKAGLSGGILSSSLSVLIVTWPLFFPSMFTGLTLWVADWDEEYLAQFRKPQQQPQREDTPKKIHP